MASGCLVLLSIGEAEVSLSYLPRTTTQMYNQLKGLAIRQWRR